MRHCHALLSVPLSAKTAITNNVHSSHQSIFQFRQINFGSLTCPTNNPIRLVPQSLEPKCKKKNKRKKTWSPNCVTSLLPQCEFPEASNEFVVVNFYRFVFIKDPHTEVTRHLSFLKGRDIHGRIYLNEQGINAQYSGPFSDALAYVEWLKEDSRFSDILVQMSPSLNGHAFPRLKLRYKPSLVQMEGGTCHLPLLDSSIRATPLAPSEWRNRLKAGHRISETSDSSLKSNCVLIDVRNRYEWDIGHFFGAQRPDVDCFRSTSFGLSYTEVISSDPLAHADKDKTDILMYCTGGIRCDVYSTILRQQGFQNLYTLEGGVSHYLKNEGPVQWVGNLFVFDDRLSLPPLAYKPEARTPEINMQEGPRSNSFAGCYICGSQVHELRHRNCANLDCNLLFLCCMDCLKDLRGCCCLKCMTAPRIRPVLSGNQRYQKWHMYRELELQSNWIA